MFKLYHKPLRDSDKKNILTLETGKRLKRRLEIFLKDFFLSMIDYTGVHCLKGVTRTGMVSAANSFSIRSIFFSYTIYNQFLELSQSVFQFFYPAILHGNTTFP